MTSRYPLTIAGTTIEEMQNGDTLILPTSASALQFKVSNIDEPSTVSATAATGTINYDITTQSVLYYTLSAGGNFTINFRGSSGTTLAALMAVGDSISVSFLNTNGATPYASGWTGSLYYTGGIKPTTVAISSAEVNVFTYTILKVGSGTYSVLAGNTIFQI